MANISDTSLSANLTHKTMTELFDLHCHSNASDGALSPQALMQRAQQQGVTCLALTDHDTINGLAAAEQQAKALNMRFISGIEISVTWENHCLHVVGLNIDPNNQALQLGITGLQSIRVERAQKIAHKLAQKRIPDVYAAVLDAAGSGMITRSHFADYLLKNGHVSTQQEAFDRYLGQGKAAYVSTTWASLPEAVAWITKAGGVAVLAHPLRYKLSTRWMNRLLTAFKSVGGQGIEVITARCSADEIAVVSKYARNFELLASIGSDFHNPANQWVELGRLQALPANLTPIWQSF